MICRMTGKIHSFREMSILLEVQGICYEVVLPKTVLDTLQHTHQEHTQVSLVTYHYYQTDPSRSIPILIGFSNEIEKEFFEKFITVSGIGPRAAAKALALSFSRIAQAIHEGDMATLTSLPGIGPQRAREIIAKLQGKMGKYSLMHDQEKEGVSSASSFLKAGKEGVTQEALSVLLQLEYKQSEAVKMIEQALQRNPSLKTCEELLNEVYRQKATVAK